MFQADFWKKISFSRFWPKTANFCHIWPFLAQKSGFLDIFFEFAHQIRLKLGQKLGTVSLNHLMAVLCPGKFLFCPFWPFLGQKYIACGDIIWFLAKEIAFWAYIFKTAHQILMIFAQMLEIVALNDLASVLRARKFSFAPRGEGGIYPQMTPF